MGIDVVGRLVEGGWRVVAVELQHAVVHVALGRDQDEQHAPGREPQELDVPEGAAAALGGDHTGKGRKLREQPGGLGQDLAGLLGHQGPLHLAGLAGLQGLDGEQRVDEQPVATRGGHATAGRVAVGNQAMLFQIGHDVADGGRRQVQARVLRQRARAHRLAVDDVVFDEGLEQDSGAFIHSAYPG